LPLTLTLLFLVVANLEIWYLGTLDSSRAKIFFSNFFLIFELTLIPGPTKSNLLLLLLLLPLLGELLQLLRHVVVTLLGVLGRSGTGLSHGVEGLLDASVPCSDGQAIDGIPGLFAHRWQFFAILLLNLGGILSGVGEDTVESGFSFFLAAPEALYYRPVQSSAADCVPGRHTYESPLR